MKILKGLILVIMVLSLATTGFAAMTAKIGTSVDGLQKGNVTHFAKGHQASVDYTPELNVNYDKQHVPWFESTLKPQNIRREGQGDPLDDAVKMVAGWFGRK